MKIDPENLEAALREIARRIRQFHYAGLAKGVSAPWMLTKDEIDAILAVYPDQKEEPMAEPVKQAVLKESALAGIRAKRLSIRECCARLRLVQDDPEKWLKALMEFCVERDMPEARGADFALRIWRDQHRVPDPGPPEPECKHLKAGPLIAPTGGDNAYLIACNGCKEWVPVADVFSNLRAALREARECVTTREEVAVCDRDAARAALAEKEREVERLRSTYERLTPPLSRTKTPHAGGGRGMSSLGRYRKKPVVIDACRTLVRCEIKTPEGGVTAEPGDWIITGVKGERYPCKPDIFAATYEPVIEDRSPDPQAPPGPAGPLAGGEGGMSENRATNDHFLPTPWQHLRDIERYDHHADYTAFEVWLAGKADEYPNDDLSLLVENLELLQQMAIFRLICDALDEHPALPAIHAAVAEIEGTGTSALTTQQMRRECLAILHKHLGPWLGEEGA